MSLERLRLARTEGVGPVTYRRLLRRFGTAEAALDALPGIARGAGRSVAPPVPGAGEAGREMDALARMGGRFLFVDDPDYPPLLAAVEGAPAALAVLGDVALLGARAVAVVGARNASANGQRFAEALATELAGTGLVVVSGMARGIDAAAHRGAMRGGRTVAAVAGGIDQPYPPENVSLQRAVAENGAVVAEAPFGTAPMARHFPRRNRVIAGLSLGVVVVEAAPRSGSLITARMAQEMGRPLFAVPGSPLDPRSRGCNDLIRSDGAVLTEGAADVTARLGRGRAPGPAGFAAPPDPFDPQPGSSSGSPAPSMVDDPVAVRLRLDELLGPEPVPVDDLLRRCQFSPSAILGVLGELEAEGAVQRVGSQVLRIVD